MPDEGRFRWTALRDSAGATLRAVLGLAPQVLHHLGLIAGAALVTGAGGKRSLLRDWARRLHRRFDSWWAPGLAIGVFAAVFSLSAFVLGPAISGQADQASTPSPSSTPTLDEHIGHHG